MRTTPQSPRSQTIVESNGTSQVLIDCKIDNLYYGKFLAVRDSHIPIEKGKITAFIGPSGCGKVTVQVVKTGITPPLATSGRFWGAEMERLHHARRLHAQQ